MINKNIDLSIIIVNHNHSDYLIKNIDSIINNTKNIIYEIILVNNTIEDKGFIKIRNNYSDITIIENKSYKGFSSNNNIGIKKSRGDYILLLNPDTYLKNNAIEIMLSYIKNNKEVGICGPKILNIDGSLQYSCRAFPTIKSFIFRRTPLRKIINQKEKSSRHLMVNISHNLPLSVDWMLGACLMINRKLINDLDLLDENYFMYCEDIDICYRIKQNHLECHYVPNAIIYHYHQGVSDKRLFSNLSFIHFKSMLYFLFKHKYIKKLFVN